MKCVTRGCVGETNGKVLYCKYCQLRLKLSGAVILVAAVATIAIWAERLIRRYL